MFDEDWCINCGMEIVFVVVVSIFYIDDLIKLINMWNEGVMFSDLGVCEGYV